MDVNWYRDNTKIEDMIWLRNMLQKSIVNITNFHISSTFVQMFVNVPKRFANIFWFTIFARNAGKTPPHNECPGYNTKQSDGEVPAVL